MTTMPSGNVFLAGVGGQGIILASEVMCEAFLSRGFDVKKSEVHGMAQRGGAVTTHIRFGERVFSPLIEAGTADLIVAFEKMEALRFRHVLKSGGTIVANAQEIWPAPVATGIERYPDRVGERLLEATPNVLLVDAIAAALKLSEPRSVNIVMVGAASRFLPLPEEAYVEALVARLPAKVKDVNVAAFRAGRALVP